MPSTDENTNLVLQIEQINSSYVNSSNGDYDEGDGKKEEDGNEESISI